MCIRDSTRIGLSLEMGLSYLLPRVVGPQAAFDLAVTLSLIHI